MNTAASAPAVRAPTREASAGKATVYLLFTFCCGLYLLPFMRVLMGGADEGTFVVGAARIVHGQVFARDFFEIEGPGTFYWLAMFFKLFGVTFAAARICLFVTSLGTGLLMYFLSRRVCARYRILPCMILAATYFGLWPAISHHVDSNFFALLSVASMALWQDRRKGALLFAAGLLAGATTCVHQPKGILLLLALLLWLAVERKRGAAPLSALGWVAAGYVGAIGPVLVYFWSRHALKDLIYANFLWPAVHYRAVNVLPYAHGIFQHYWDWWILSGKGHKWMVGMGVVLIVPFLFVAALPVLLLILGALRRGDAFRPEILLYWLCGSALWLSEFHRKDIFHLVFGSPLLIILCIYLLEGYRRKVASIALQVLAMSAGCLACFNFFLVLAAAHSTTTRVGSVAMFRIDPVLKALEEHAAPGEEIFAYPYCPIYYFLSATTNPTRYSILLYDFNTPSQFEEAIRVLDRDRVRYVVWNADFLAQEEAGMQFPSAKHMRPGELIFEPYLESHYRVVWAGNGFRLMERKSEAVVRTPAAISSASGEVFKDGIAKSLSQ